jgi:heat-inducible transcriptional repressor
VRILSADMERDRLILKEIVEAHIDTGEAVGSRAVAERMGRRLSAASIRAVMQDLGQRGFIAQPHTSAGRVPTDLGWRVYLDEVLVRRSPHPDDRRRIEAIGWSEGTPVPDMLRRLARATAEGLGLATAVVMPRLDTRVLRRLELVLLREGRVLAIAVTSAGLVHERLLHVAQALGRAELERFSNYLNTLLPGHSLSQVRRVIERELGAMEDAALREALVLGQRALGGDDGPEVLVEGAARVLAQREFTEDPERGPDLLRTLEERTIWIGLIDELVGADDVRVYLGEESGHRGFSSCALVATRVGGERGDGAVVLVGPKRIDYRRVLPFARLLGARLGEILDVAS